MVFRGIFSNQNDLMTNDFLLTSRESRQIHINYRFLFIQFEFKMKSGKLLSFVTWESQPKMW